MHIPLGRTCCCLQLQVLDLFFCLKLSSKKRHPDPAEICMIKTYFAIKIFTYLLKVLYLVSDFIPSSFKPEYLVKGNIRFYQPPPPIMNEDHFFLRFATYLLEEILGKLFNLLHLSFFICNTGES